MRKVIPLLFVLVFLSACTTSWGTSSLISALEDNETAFDDVSAKFEVKAYSSLDLTLSKTELSSIHDDTVRLQSELEELQTYTENRRELVLALQNAHPDDTTGQYLEKYTTSLNYYTASYGNYSLGFENSLLFFQFATLDAEYTDLDEKISNTWDDFVFNVNNRDFENASLEVDENLAYLSREMDILDEEDTLIPFAFTSNNRDITQIYIDYFTAAQVSLADAHPSVDKLNTDLEDSYNRMNLYVSPTSSEVGDEVDSWVKPHIYDIFSAADDSFNDGDRKWEIAQDYYKEDLNKELKFSSF